MRFSPVITNHKDILVTTQAYMYVRSLVLGPLYIRAHLELSLLGLEVGLNFSPTLQSGP